LSTAVAKIVMNDANMLAAFGCFALIALMLQKRVTKTYGFLVALLAVRGIMALASVLLLFHRRELGVEVHSAYRFYFYSYWTSALVQMSLQALVIYGVYRIALKPLDGLKRIGSIVFRWAGSVAAVLALVVALGPHAQGANYFATLMSQMQQGVSVLTVCLLLFVCFAARPLGVTFRSRSFGVALGLGFNSTATLVLSAWFSTAQTQSLYSPVFAIGSLVSVLTLFVWGAYFVLPEPVRKMITLPTTSPYFFWNKISEALGDDPGAVVVAGFTPNMLAPAEMQALIAIGARPHEDSFESVMPVHALAASL
jgi:hypothetical protein